VDAVTDLLRGCVTNGCTRFVTLATNADAVAGAEAAYGVVPAAATVLTDGP
jgi:hypothetical protein